jgi:hypothetical protein
MKKRYEIFKTPCGPSTGKALLNLTIFSPSQTGETVPLNAEMLTFADTRNVAVYRFLTIYVYMLPFQTENGSLVSWVGERSMVIDVNRVSKHAHLYFIR